MDSYIATFSSLITCAILEYSGVESVVGSAGGLSCVLLCNSMMHEIMIIIVNIHRLLNVHFLHSQARSTAYQVNNIAGTLQIIIIIAGILLV